MLGFSPLASLPVADDTNIQTDGTRYAVVSVTTNRPTVQEAVLEQVHNFVAPNLTTGPLTFGTVTFSRGQSFSADVFVTNPPDVPVIDFLSKHLLLAANITTSDPILGDTIVSIESSSATLSVNTFLLSPPNIDEGFITQRHILNSGNLTSGLPLVPQTALLIKQDFSTDNVTTGSPSVEESYLAAFYPLLVQGVLTQNPTVGSVDLSQRHSFARKDLYTSLFISPTRFLFSEASFGDFNTVVLEKSQNSVLLGASLNSVVLEPSINSVE